MNGIQLKWEMEEKRGAQRTGKCQTERGEGGEKLHDDCCWGCLEPYFWPFESCSHPTDISVCEIEPVLPAAHEDTSTSESLPFIMRKPVIMMIGSFTPGVFQHSKARYCMFEGIKPFSPLFNISECSAEDFIWRNFEHVEGISWTLNYAVEKVGKKRDTIHDKSCVSDGCQHCGTWTTADPVCSASIPNEKSVAFRSSHDSGVSNFTMDLTLNNTLTFILFIRRHSLPRKKF